METGAVLLDVLSRLERRYRMPPLPNDLEEVRVAGSDVSVAFALEKARVALDGGTAPDTSLRSLFTTALAGLIKAALKPGAGDPAFQAMVLRSRSAEVDEFVTLAASHGADRRTVLSAVNAFAHPGKTGIHPATDAREALSNLHGLASSGDWQALRALVDKLIVSMTWGDESQRSLLASLSKHPALPRLARGQALRSNVDVQRYEALLAQQGTLAGSDAARKKGMAAGRRGEEEEARAADALRALADALDRREPSTARHRVVTSLLVPAGFPGHSRHAKSEWDVTLVRERHDGVASDVCVLAEVKSSPDAAVADFPRLMRGLRRLAQADADAGYTFACREGSLRIHGHSLQRLHPKEHSLPSSVIYVCAADSQRRPSILSAASKGLLMRHAASLEFARTIVEGGCPDAEELGSVWAAATTAPQLRSVLRQYEVACIVRESMVHPDDLKALAVAA